MNYEAWRDMGSKDICLKGLGGVFKCFPKFIPVLMHWLFHDQFISFQLFDTSVAANISQK